MFATDDDGRRGARRQGQRSRGSGTSTSYRPSLSARAVSTAVFVREGAVATCTTLAQRSASFTARSIAFTLAIAAVGILFAELPQCITALAFGAEFTATSGS